MDQLAEQGLQRVLGDKAALPGLDRLTEYLRGRARREANKQSEEQLQQFLGFLEQLMRSVRTGEQFEEVLAAARASRNEEQAA